MVLVGGKVILEIVGFSFTDCVAFGATTTGSGFTSFISSFIGSSTEIGAVSSFNKSLISSPCSPRIANIESTGAV